MDSLSVMIVALNDYKLRQAPPDVVIRPNIPPGVTALTGYNRAPEIIAAGESAAEEALPDIQRVLAEAARRNS